MAATLVNDLTGLFKSQALGEAAAQLGEPENSVLRGFQAASAAILGGLASHTGQPGFMRQAYELITSPLNDGRFLDNIRGFFSGRGNASNEGLSGRMLSMLFGGDQSKVAQDISQASGLRASSATTLMGYTAPLVLGLLGRRVQEGHLDANGLSTLLQSESSGIRNMMPGTTTTTTSTTTGPIRTTVTPETVEPIATSVERASSPARWLWPLLLAIAAILLLSWLLNRGRETTRVATDAVRNAVPAATDAARSATGAVGDFVHRKLSNGVELNIPRNGMEWQLVTFIEDPTKQVDPNTWFEFDRLSFDTNSATLRPESQDQLNSLAAVLKAYPNVHVKIGGYTDNTGDPTANMKLSQDRADSVMRSLVALGVPANHMEAQGYGDQHPIADNSTAEGRAKNRRIALRVTEK